MNDIATIGHNGAPHPIDEISPPFEDARTEAEGWLDGKPVQTLGQMQVVDELRGSMRQFRLALERGQKVATTPLHDAYKRELERWKPTIADVKLIEDGLVALVDGFKKEEASRREAATKAAWNAAEAARKEAEAIAASANPGNIEDQRAIVQAREVAEIARTEASIAQRDTVKGMRDVTLHKVTDHRALLHWIAKNDKPAITAFIDEWARRNHKPNPNADGLDVWVEKEAY